MAKEPQRASDETVEGGRYIVGDVTVDAFGKPIPQPKAAAKSEASSESGGKPDEKESE